MLLNAFSILIKTEEKEVLLFQKLQLKAVFTMSFPKCSHTSCSSSYFGVMPCTPHYIFEWGLLWNVIKPYNTCLFFMCLLKQICWLEQLNVFLLLLTPACPAKWRALPSPVCHQENWLQRLSQVSEGSVPEGVVGCMRSLYSACKSFLDKSREGGDPEWLSKPWYLFRITS